MDFPLVSRQRKYLTFFPHFPGWPGYCLIALSFVAFFPLVSAQCDNEQQSWKLEGYVHLQVAYAVNAKRPESQFCSEID